MHQVLLVNSKLKYVWSNFMLISPTLKHFDIFFLLDSLDENDICSLLIYSFCWILWRKMVVSDCLLLLWAALLALSLISAILLSCAEGASSSSKDRAASADDSGFYGTGCAAGCGTTCGA